MIRWKKRIRKITYVLSDVIALLLAFIISDVIFTDIQKGILDLSGLERIGLVTMFGGFLIFFFLVFFVYEKTIEMSGSLSLRTIMLMVLSMAMTDVLIGSLLFFLKKSISRKFLLDYTIAIIICIAVGRLILKYLNFSKRERDKKGKRILVVGHSPRGQMYINEIKEHEYLNLEIMGYISIKETHTYDGYKHLGSIDNLEEIAVEYVIDEIAVARPLSYDERLEAALETCQSMGITVTMLLDLQNTETTKAQVAMVGNLPVLTFHTVSLNENQLFMKRAMDVAGGLVGMLIFGFAFIIVGPLIKLESPGPVIFKQTRVGKNGRQFQVWKFRSMGVDAEARKAALMSNNEMSGHMFKMTNDPRITKVGAFIRKTSIDEIPQFYNVLKGDMSLVGTRPPTLAEVQAYDSHHHKRISIPPGITGNWQVSGRSEIEDFEEVVRLDYEYIKNWSIWLDIRIIIKTFLVVLKRKGSK